MFELAMLILAVADPLPAPLQCMLEARQAIKTAEIEWTIIDGQGGAPERIRSYRAVFGDEGYFLEDQGDARGVVTPGPDGEAEPLYGLQKRRWLLWEGDLWEHTERYLKARVYRDRRDILDARSFGLGATLSARDVADSLRGADIRATCEPIGSGQHRAIARQGSQRLEWLIDERAGWNPNRARIFHDDVLRAEATILNERIGSIWFPRRIVYVHFDEDGRAAGEQTLEVRRAEFNQPSHPRRVSPEFLQLEVGTNIRLFTTTSTGQTLPIEPLFAWDGRQRVPHSEFTARVHAGELKLGPAFRAEVDRLMARGAIYRRFESQWRDTVERFIKANTLDGDQAERARLILQDCVEQARAYVAAQRETLDKIAAASDDQSQTDLTRARAAELERLRQQMVNLESPIHEIEREQLNPRLRSLLTSEQLRLLEARRAKTSSRPAAAQPNQNPAAANE